MPTCSETKEETQGGDYLRNLVDAFVSGLDHSKRVCRITGVCRKRFILKLYDDPVGFRVDYVGKNECFSCSMVDIL